MTPPQEDHYQVLGVDCNASDSDLTKAYKKLALKYHPDKSDQQDNSSGETFKRITEAYNVLHDPEQRKCYDDQRDARAFHQGILQEAEHFLQEQEVLSNMARLAQNRDLAGLRDALEDAEQLGLDTRQFQELLHSFSRQVEEIRGRLRKIEEYMITFEAVKCQKNGTWPTVEAKLSQRGLTVIHEVAEILKDFPGLPVRIEGFSNDSNCIRGKALSQARAQLVKDCLLKSGCTNWMTIVAWGIGHEMKKKVVRIVPQVNLDDEDCDSTLLQLLRESFDRNQEPKIGSGSVSNEMVMEREQKDNVHSQETEKAAVSQVSMPSRASALRKGSASSGFLECW